LTKNLRKENQNKVCGMVSEGYTSFLSVRILSDFGAGKTVISLKVHTRRRRRRRREFSYLGGV
jgi:hypothetical protein